MQRARWFAFSLAVLLLVTVAFQLQAGQMKGTPSRGRYGVLAPMSSGNLTIFPVVADSQADTRMFITLDEGLRSGEVVVTEAGNVQPLIRRRPVRSQQSSAQVNTLMLVNNSKKPLLLLAGEIVTGGKQDRVIGKDRIVPAESDPIDLGVFCVEPGRWVAQTDRFNTFGGLAAPNVRKNAMAKKDQQQVWDAVRDSNAKTAENLAYSARVAGAPPPSPQVLSELRSTSSYARVMENKSVQQQVDKLAEPIQRSYQALIKDLRAKNAVGVVVAVNGQMLWADIFASTDLLEKYWPKLIRSYVAEAMTQGGSGGKVLQSEAQAFVDRLDGTHENADTEPGVYRQAEITGSNYKVFELTSLLPKTDFTVHVAKMHDEEIALNKRPVPFVR